MMMMMIGIILKRKKGDEKIYEEICEDCRILNIFLVFVNMNNFIIKIF
jgi:hypothetical protein